MKYSIPIIVLFACLLLAATDTAWMEIDKQGFTPKEVWGKEIYTKGTSPSGEPIIAMMSGIEVPASVLVCANCHGFDAKGNPEGGVTPTDLRWEMLTKNYETRHSNGRTHTAYTENTLKRAITMGLDPASNTLNVTMPRYRMSQKDMDALIAYLKKIGTESDLGIDANMINIGVLLPTAPELTRLRSAISKILQAYFTEINEQGGVYNRQITLLTSPSLDENSPPSVSHNFLKTTEIFALTGSFLQENEQATIALINQQQIPLVGAFSQNAEENFQKNRYLFYLLPDLKQQAIALAKHISNKETSKIAIVFQPLSQDEILVESVKKVFAAQNKALPKMVALTPENLQTKVTQFKTEDIQQVLFLNIPAAEMHVLKEAMQQKWYPNFFSIGAVSGLDPLNLPIEFDQKIHLAFPTWLTATNETGIQYYQYLKNKYQLPNHYKQSQLQALAGAMLLVESLKKSGKTLSRTKLIAELEKVYQFETGLIPALTYNLNRRMGSEKVFIVRNNLKDKRLDCLN